MEQVKPLKLPKEKKEKISKEDKPIKEQKPIKEKKEKLSKENKVKDPKEVKPAKEKKIKKEKIVKPKCLYNIKIIDGITHFVLTVPMDVIHKAEDIIYASTVLNTKQPEQSLEEPVPINDTEKVANL